MFLYGSLASPPTRRLLQYQAEMGSGYLNASG